MMWRFIFINSPSFFISKLELSSLPIGKSFDGIFGNEDKIPLSSNSISALIASFFEIDL